MKNILLIATGGTIASKYTAEGLAPQISADELLEYIPEAREFCTIDTVQPFALDSTNVCADHWLKLARLIESKYEFYDGFVLCHGTDTMAYTAAALSYLIQNNRRPIVITGAQKPIDLAITASLWHTALSPAVPSVSVRRKDLGSTGVPFPGFLKAPYSLWLPSYPLHCKTAANLCC